MASDQGSCGKTFADRYFYNSNFVHSQLFDNNHTQKLKLMCRYVNPDVFYSDVLKKPQFLDGGEQNNKTVVECFCKTPQHGKINKGKSLKLYSSNIESPKSLL